MRSFETPGGYNYHNHISVNNEIGQIKAQFSAQKNKERKKLSYLQDFNNIQLIIDKQPTQVGSRHVPKLTSSKKNYKNSTYEHRINQLETGTPDRLVTGIILVFKSLLISNLR